jgi:hypothetical protein
MVRISLETQKKNVQMLITALHCGMSDYAAPETLSHQDLNLILDKLPLLLDNLPNQLPSKPVNGPDASQYVSFVGFQPDDELIQMTGSKVGALNVAVKYPKTKHLMTGRQITV